MKKIASDVYVSSEFVGVTVGCVVMPEGVIAIDAPTLPQDAQAWRQQVEDVGEGPILYTVLTDAHPDRLLSAGLLGAPLVASYPAYQRAEAYTDGFWRSVIDGWSKRYPEITDLLDGWEIGLPDIMFTESLTLHKGGHPLVIHYVDGGAPGSAWVHLRERNVLFAGDTVVVDRHPFIEATVDSKAWLNTLKRLRRSRYSRTKIVPGRGRVCDPSDTKVLSDYLALARRRARSLLQGERSRVDKTAAANEILEEFKVPEDLQDTVRRRIKSGLDQLCDELERKSMQQKKGD